MTSFQPQECGDGDADGKRRSRRVTLAIRQGTAAARQLSLLAVAWVFLFVAHMLYGVMSAAGGYRSCFVWGLV